MTVLGSKISSQNARRLTSADYEVKAYALSDKQNSDYLKQQQVHRNARKPSLNSDKTISVESDENEVDELYRGGSSDSHSYDDLASPTGLLRLSGK